MVVTQPTFSNCNLGLLWSNDKVQWSQHALYHWTIKNYISPHLFSLLMCGSAPYHNDLVMHAGMKSHIVFSHSGKTQAVHSGIIHKLGIKQILRIWKTHYTYREKKNIHYPNSTHKPNLPQVTSFLSCVCTI